MAGSLKKKDKLTDLFVLCLYAAGIIFVSCFHELWFDETQAWLIARCASYKEMFTYIPHYEGHPPLWHLLLSVFAKNGAPVDFTLKAINTIFSVTAMALLIFRSPFPKIVRYVLPFTFYFFYQYGVLSRPYSIVMIAFFLLAITYKERNAHPWRYILVMTLLCLTTAYGIMISGGLCIVWSFEIISELIRTKKIKFFWKDMRFYSLCFILVIALAVIVMIIPADDCYYTGVDNNNTILDMLTNFRSYELFAIMPFESWSGVLTSLNSIENIIPLDIIEVLCGMLIWFGLCAVTVKNGKFITFFLPYVITTAFMSFKFSSLHHYGLGSLYHIFVFWIMAEQNGRIEIPEIFYKLNKKVVSPLLRKLAVGVGVLICVAPVIYSVIASVDNIMSNIGLACIADFIKENNLENNKIMINWTWVDNLDGDNANANEYVFMQLEMPSNHPEIKEHRTYLMEKTSTIQPYFDKNIFMNFNVDRPDDLYMHFQYKEDVEKVFEKWREKGLPDFIIGYCPIDEVYDDETIEGVRYLPIRQFKYKNYVYKMGADAKYIYIYMRDDLFDDYPQFKWINDQKGNVYERKTS